jgi:hypothetical protein
MLSVASAASKGQTASSNYMRISPVCATLAWNNKEGTVETRAPRKVKDKGL